jgi:hypothetical protein
VLLGVIVLAYDRELVYVEPRPLEFFDGRFCFGVGVVDLTTALFSAMGYLRRFGFNVW